MFSFKLDIGFEAEVGPNLLDFGLSSHVYMHHRSPSPFGRSFPLFLLRFPNFMQDKSCFRTKRAIGRIIASKNMLQGMPTRCLCKCFTEKGWFSGTRQNDDLEEMHDGVAEMIKEDLWVNPRNYFNIDADEEEEFGDEDDEELTKWERTLAQMTWTKRRRMTNSSESVQGFAKVFSFRDLIDVYQLVRFSSTRKVDRTSTVMVTSSSFDVLAVESAALPL
ncbi:hypothetical protein M8C21_008818 [Ambrosia artemisiifolia]|uniref:Uncharacterized protein n=1 Tax=Ambrosia artemisiifolia TaxID=4212 RepID=A0AAD5GLC4_AMBAR|nr:hypothetical protein M8C21_008818 [Ambrosia artemisiifolia]